MLATNPVIVLHYFVDDAHDFLHHTTIRITITIWTVQCAHPQCALLMVVAEVVVAVAVAAAMVAVEVAIPVVDLRIVVHLAQQSMTGR